MFRRNLKYRIDDVVGCNVSPQDPRGGSSKLCGVVEHVGGVSRPALEPPAQPVLHLALRRARDRRELLHHAVAAVGALDGVGGGVDGAEAEPSISSCLSSRSWVSSYGSDICVLLMHFLPGCLGPATATSCSPYCRTLPRLATSSLQTVGF